MALARRLEPEWLDELPPDDPRARRSRRELRLVNALMGNARYMARALQGSIADGARLADLGTGDGMLMLRIAERLRPRPAGVTLALVDRLNAVSEETLARFAALGWRAAHHAADAADWLRATSPCDAITVNLFLHHLERAPLAELLALIAARTRAFVACEPRRSALALSGSHALVLLGIGPVTRHDAVLSVRAGFADDELSRAWPDAGAWALEERRVGLFSHLFAARRR